MTLNKLIHPKRFLHRYVPLILSEAGRRPFACPKFTWNRIVMKRDGVHHPMRLPHHNFHPAIVVYVRPACDFMDFVLAIVAHIGLVSSILIRIVFRTHIAAAAPVLVPDAKIFYLPRLLSAVCLAQISHRRNAVEGHIFHPLRHFLYRAAAYVAGDIRLALQHLA
ncbi:hypothetical protein D3C78_1333070 [compost metagenome]